MTIQVYVGTYAKYNNASIKGEWVDLEDYDTEDAFYERCAEIHADEEDPEFMFQDFEGFPKDYYGESGLDAEIWEWLELDDDDRELWAAAQACFGEISFKNAQDAFQGQYDSDEEFAQEMADDCGMLDRDLSWPYTCIDWEWAARELMYDYSSHDGHYFSSNW